MIKRIFVMFLALVMLSGNVYAVNMAQESENVDGFNLLTTLGIVDSVEDASLEKSVTRGELAQIAVRMKNISLGEPDTAYFYDVPPEYELAVYVNQAAQLGLMLGYGDGYFMPERKVSYEEVCKVMCVVAGGTEYGAAIGYEMLAAQKGITVKGAYDSSRRTVYKMVLNTLHAKMTGVSSFSAEKNQYYEKDELVMERYFDISYVRGVVTSVFGTGLDAVRSDVKPGQAEIDGKIYSGVDEDFLGKYVYCYFKDDESDIPEAVYVYADSKKNNILTVEANKIMYVKDFQFTYEDGSRSSKIDISREHMSVIYNGIALPDWDNEDFIPNSGFVEFIDNNGDGEYEIACIHAYELFRVGHFDAENKVIYDYYKQQEPIELSKKSEYTKFIRGGMEMPVEMIRQDMYLSVQRSINRNGERKCRLELHSFSVTGTVSSKSTEEIIVNKITMNIAKQVFGDDLSKVAAGDSVTVWVLNNEAIMLEYASEKSYKQAYLIDVYYNDGLPSEIQFRFADATAVIKELYGAERISVDGILYKDHEQIAAALEASAKKSNYSAEMPYSQPIRYMTNAEGKINEIDTCVYNSAKETDESLIQDIAFQKVTFYSSPSSFYDSADTWNLKATITNDTSVIIVPTQERDSAPLYNFVKGSKVLSNGNNYSIEVYNIDENYTADLVIIYLNTLKTVPPAAPACIFEETAARLGTDGNETRIVKYWLNGAINEKQLAEGVSLPTKLDTGDVIRFRENYAGEISVIEKSFDVETLPAESERIKNTRVTTVAYDSEIRLIFGTLLFIKDGVITHTTSLADDPDGLAVPKNLDNYLVGTDTIFARYNSSRKKVEMLGNLQSAFPASYCNSKGSRMLLQTRDGVLKLVYIID